MSSENSRKREKCSCEKAAIEKSHGDGVHLQVDFTYDRIWICKHCFETSEEFSKYNSCYWCACCKIQGSTEGHRMVKIKEQWYCNRCISRTIPGKKSKRTNVGMTISTAEQTIIANIAEKSIFCNPEAALFFIFESKCYIRILDLIMFIDDPAFPPRILDSMEKNVERTLLRKKEKRDHCDYIKLVNTTKIHTGVSIEIAHKIAKRISRAADHKDGCKGGEMASPETFFLWMTQFFPSKKSRALILQLSNNKS